MKEFIIFFLILLLLQVSVYNPTDELFLSFEFLVQGSSFDTFHGGRYLSLYNLLFNTGMFILFISMICSRISKNFCLYLYIITRGSEAVFKKILIRNTLCEILKVIFAKLLIYVLFFFFEQNIIRFILYDLVSTFLTLTMFSLVFILFKLNGVNEKILLFILISGNMTAQILSFEVGWFSIIIIASIHWWENPFVVIMVKLSIILLLAFILFFKKSVNQMLGVKEQ